MEMKVKELDTGGGGGGGGVGSIQFTKKHYIPESTFIYKQALRKHMQGGICMPCGLLFYVCWIIKMYVYMWQEKVYDPKT